MGLTFDPEIAAALAPMAESGFAPPAVGDIAGRRAMWEPIIGAASTAQPIPEDVKTTEHHATADDGTQIKMRWYAKDGAEPGPAVLFLHGGGYIFGHSPQALLMGHATPHARHDDLARQRRTTSLGHARQRLHPADAV
jgi:acetyl esterase/lipase